MKQAITIRIDPELGVRTCPCQGGKSHFDQFSRDRAEGARQRVQLVSQPTKRQQQFKWFVE
jgi:hypothetical protein